MSGERVVISPDAFIRAVPEPRDAGADTRALRGEIYSGTLEIVDSFKPWELWEIEKTTTDYGDVLVLTDHYLPPAQRLGGVKGDAWKVPGGISDFTTVQGSGWKLATPASVLFSDPNKWGVKLDAYWRGRMGIKEISQYISYGAPWLKMMDGTYFSFVGVRCDTGGSREYGAFSHLGLSEMAYACTLLAPHLPTYFGHMKNGDHFWVRVQVGGADSENKRTHLFAVSKNIKQENGALTVPNYHIITTSEGLVPLLLEDLKELSPDGYQPTLSGDSSAQKHQENLLRGSWKSDRFGLSTALETAELLTGVSEKVIIDQLPSVVVRIPNHLDSFENKPRE